MKLLIHIPKEFERHFKADRFEDSLYRLNADAHLLAGIYEQETALMLIEAFKNAVVVPLHGDLIDKSKIHKAIPAEEDNCTGMGMSYDEMTAYNDGIDAMYNLIQKAKPIIEAEKNKMEAL